MATINHSNLTGSELHIPKTHKSSHTDGTDDIQSATAAQKGLATATQITKLDGIEALADVTDTANVDAAGAVMDTDFNAQTIMIAVADDTPVATVVPAGNMVGRLTAGNLDSLTATQVRTLLNVDDGADVTGNNAPQAHQATHNHGGSDALKLDDLANPDDNTDLNAITTRHGLMPKLSGNTIDRINGLGAWVTSLHAVDHTDGTDDIQSATAAQKGLATAAQITKLDGVETGATKYPDTGEQAFLDADHTKLDGVEALADVTDATNVASAGAIMDGDFTVAEGFMKKNSAGVYEALKSNMSAAVAPTVNEDNGDGYVVGSRWLDTTADKEYICLDMTIGAAVWKETTATGSGSGDMLKSVYDSNDDGVIAEAQGGTDQSTYAQGDLLYASAANTLAKLAKGAATNVLTMNAGATAPEWTAAPGGGDMLKSTYDPNDDGVIAVAQTEATKYPDTGEQAFLDADHTKLDGIATGAIAEVVSDTTPQLGGDLDLNGHEILVDTTPGTDHTASGMKGSFTNGNAGQVVFGDVCYMAADGHLEFADADAATTMPAIYMALETIAAAASGAWLMMGVARDDTWNWTIGPGTSGLIYVSLTGTTTNTLTQTAPSATGDQVQVVGTAITADTMMFNPSPVLVEIA